jgi:hypothetical protein
MIRWRTISPFDWKRIRILDDPDGTLQFPERLLEKESFDGKSAG